MNANPSRPTPAHETRWVVRGGGGCRGVSRDIAGVRAGRYQRRVGGSFHRRGLDAAVLVLTDPLPYFGPEPRESKPCFFKGPASWQAMRRSRYFTADLPLRLRRVPAPPMTWAANARVHRHQEPRYSMLLRITAPAVRRITTFPSMPATQLLARIRVHDRCAEHPTLSRSR